MATPSEPKPDMGPACAHKRVRHETLKAEGGRVRDQWACDLCGSLFVPQMFLARAANGRAELAEAKLAEARRSVAQAIKQAEAKKRADYTPVGLSVLYALDAMLKLSNMTGEIALTSSPTEGPDRG